MTTERRSFTVSGIRVEVLRKNIKNLHLGVYPPSGRVRVAAPARLDNEAIRLAIVSRLPWIRRQQAAFKQQERQSAREMVTGESHYFRGRRYRLRILEKPGRPLVQLVNNTTIRMCIQPGATREDREELLQKWYRDRLRCEIPPLLPKWERKIGVKVSEIGIKKMKTRWGSCNADARRIWLNLELAKKPASCIEYLLVHEMVHLLERHHNDRFRNLMDGLMPGWRLRREELNRAPLAHETWDY